MIYLVPTAEFYKSILDNIICLISVVNRSGQITYLNDTIKANLGYAPEDLIGTELREITHPADWPLLEFLLQCTIVQHTLPQIRLKNKNQEWCRMEVLSAKMLDDTQELLVSWREVPHQVNDKIKDIYFSVFNQPLFLNHPDAIYTLNLQGYITHTNEAVSKIMSYAPHEIIGHHFSEFVKASLTGEAGEVLQTVIQQGVAQTLDTKVYTKEGQLLDLNIIVVPVLLDETVEGVQCIVKNITEEKSLQAQLELLSLVASKTINGVIIANSRGRIEWVNNSFCKLTGFSFGEVANVKLKKFLRGGIIATEDQEDGWERKVLTTEHFSFEIPFTKKNGEGIWLSLEMNPLLDDNGALLKLVCTQMDITEQKRYQLELLDLAKDLYVHNRDLQQSTYIISHNLRAPVANAIGLANLIAKLDSNSELYKASFGKLKTSVHQIDTILKDVNHILSIRDNQDMVTREEVKVLEVWRQAVQNLEEPLHQCGGTVQLDVDPNFTISTKRAYLHSIFYNLLSNAIKYRSPERLLQVRVTCCLEEAGKTLLSFEDNGSGMDMEKVERHLFKLYKRFHTYGEGRGIGLYLVKTHVEALDGHIEVESQVNVGTRFIIYLK